MTNKFKNKLKELDKLIQENETVFVLIINKQTLTKDKQDYLKSYVEVINYGGEVNIKVLDKDLFQKEIENMYGTKEDLIIHFEDNIPIQKLAISNDIYNKYNNKINDIKKEIEKLKSNPLMSEIRESIFLIKQAEFILQTQENDKVKENELIKIIKENEAFLKENLKDY